MAVTPFILNYPFYPFANFSWLDNEGEPYPQYGEVKGIQKAKNEPAQIEKYEVIKFSLPSLLPVNFVFKGKIILKNTGQSIWGEKPFIIVSQASGSKLTNLILNKGKLVKPGEKTEFEFILETLGTPGEYLISWENLPEHKLKIFGVGQLTKNKGTFLNKLLKKIYNFWYRL